MCLVALVGDEVGGAELGRWMCLLLPWMRAPDRLRGTTDERHIPLSRRCMAYVDEGFTSR